MPVTSTVDVVKTRVCPCLWTSPATIDGNSRDFPQPVVPWTWMWRQPLRISLRSLGICLAMVVCCGWPGHIKNKYSMLYIWNIVSLNRRMYCNRCCHRFCLRITVHFRENIICKNDVCVIWQSCKCHISMKSSKTVNKKTIPQKQALRHVVAFVQRPAWLERPGIFSCCVNFAAPNTSGCDNITSWQTLKFCSTAASCSQCQTVGTSP